MTSPTVIVFSLIKTVLDDAALAGAFGPGPPLIRFKRFRLTTPEERAERGCIAIDFEGDLLETDESLSIGELQSRLSFGLVLDYDVPLEDEDPTALGSFQPYLPIAMAALKAEASPFYDRGWFFTMGALEPDENAGNDVARLVQHASVVYRTSTVDPTQLYGQE